jgi:hypothetical protein
MFHLIASASWMNLPKEKAEPNLRVIEQESFTHLRFVDWLQKLK